MNSRAAPKFHYVIWVLVAAVCGLLIATQLKLSVSLAYFLPKANGLAEEVLVDRFGRGPGARLIMMSIAIPPGRQAEEVSDELRDALQNSGAFSSVLNGRVDLSPDSIPAIVRENSHLMADLDLSIETLTQVLNARLQDLALIDDPQMLELMAMDPALNSLQIMQSLDVLTPLSEAQSVWTDPANEEIYLIAETLAPSFDLPGQQRAQAVIGKLLTQDRGLDVELFGVGVYSVGLRHRIEREAWRRSLLATAAIILILWAAYRSAWAPVLAALPIVLGALAGMASVAVIFGQVHGITLAFGFTLFGVAVDYPLHTLSHARGVSTGDRFMAIWPTLRLGALSTALAFFALVISGSQGLAEIGVFSTVGVLVALLATRGLVADLAPRLLATHGSSTARPARTDFRHQWWLLVLLGASAFLSWSPSRLWSNQIAAMTPVAPEILQRDAQLRRQLGTPDLRYLLAISGETQEQALQDTEALAPILARAKESGLLRAYASVTTLLPSEKTQQRRLEAIKQAENIDENLRQAAASTVFRADAFQDFTQKLESVRREGLTLTAERFKNTQLESVVSGSLYQARGRWISLVTLYDIADPQALQEVLASASLPVNLVNLSAAAESLVSRYRSRIIALLGIAFLALSLFVTWRIRRLRRVAWVLGVLSASAAATLSISALLLGSLSLFNLIATVLVAGLGLDYALFSSRSPADGSEHEDTRHAVNVCGLSTFCAFLILAFSDIPILRAIGVSVAAGVAVSFILARIGVAHRHATS